MRFRCSALRLLRGERVNFVHRMMHLVRSFGVLGSLLLIISRKYRQYIHAKQESVITKQETINREIQELEREAIRIDKIYTATNVPLDEMEQFEQHLNKIREVAQNVKDEVTEIRRPFRRLMAMFPCLNRIVTLNSQY